MVKPPKINFTKNYSQFKAHQLNRQVFSDSKPLNKLLLKSMIERGFDPNISTITVYKDPVDGKFEILFGHNRFVCARHLDLPIFFTISEERFDPRVDDGSIAKKWQTCDYVHAFAADGNPHYKDLIAIASKCKLPITGAVAGVLSGNFINTKSKDIRSGEFEITINGSKCWRRIVTILLEVTDGDEDLRKAGFLIGTRALSVIAAMCSVKDFKPEHLAAQIRKYPSHVQEQTSRAAYLLMFENLYNKGLMPKTKYLFSSDVRTKVDEIAGKSVTKWWED